MFYLMRRMTQLVTDRKESFLARMLVSDLSDSIVSCSHIRTNNYIS